MSSIQNNQHKATKLGLTIVFALFTVGASFAQDIAAQNSPGVIDKADELSAPDIIFSNFGPGSEGGYEFGVGLTVAGKDAAGFDENWIAMAFVPKIDARAKVLILPLSYISGTRRVNVGIYSTNVAGSVGTVLPDGEAAVSQMPDFGDCCNLARVKLPGQGAMLAAGTTYWLVASPDNVNASTFEGNWDVSNFGFSGERYAGGAWSSYAGYWPAAQIRGETVKAPAVERIDHHGTVSNQAKLSATDVTIFTNLGPTLLDTRYNRYSSRYVTGPNAPDFAENWLALPFTPRADAHAKSLAAAIAYIKGTKKVNLGIYSDSGGRVGTLLPGGQASTTEIPTFGDCCQLTNVTLPGTGVALSAGTQYWLVASTDDVGAPDFEGGWSDANAFSAYQAPEYGNLNWTILSGLWLAAEIRGTAP